MVNNQLELGELFAAGEFVELEAVALDEGADAAAAALFAFANKREANGFGHASTCNIDNYIQKYCQETMKYTNYDLVCLLSFNLISFLDLPKYLFFRDIGHYRLLLCIVFCKQNIEVYI